MNKRELIESILGDKYKCLECEENETIISYGTDDEPYILNVEIGDSNDLTVNIIDKDRKIIVDSYEDCYENEDEFKDKVVEARTSYEVILSAKPKIEEKINKEVNKMDKKKAVDTLEDIKDVVTKFLDSVKDDETLNDESTTSLAQAIQTIVNDVHSVNENILDGSIADIQIRKKSTDEEIIDAIEDATISQLLQAVVDKLNEEVEDTEDEVTERVLSDIAVQTEEMMDELTSVLQED